MTNFSKIHKKAWVVIASVPDSKEIGMPVEDYCSHLGSHIPIYLSHKSASKAAEEINEIRKSMKLSQIYKVDNINREIIQNSVFKIID